MAEAILAAVDGRTTVWSRLRLEAVTTAADEPALSSLLNATILNHSRLADALAYHLAQKLGGADMNALQMREVCAAAYAADPTLAQKAERDITATAERDPACRNYLQPFLFYKGFAALQAQRVAHWLWHQNRETLALHLQSRTSELFGVDIHPAARMGSGIMLDHATGIVIGETAVVGDDVSMLHSVTLGGTGKETGDRHPKIGEGVLIGAGAKVLGNIKVGDHARIAAGSVVLQDVGPYCTVAGVPAKTVGGCCPNSADNMDQLLDGMGL